MTKETTAATPPVAEQDRLEAIVKWVRAHERPVAVAGVVVALAAFGVWYAIAAKGRREAFARRELAQARVSADAGNFPLASSDLSRVVSSAGGTAAGQEARLLLAEVRLMQGQADLAASELRDFVAAGPQPAYRAQAHELLGVALEQTGQPQAAAEAYRDGAQAAADAGYTFLQAALLLSAGRTFAVAGDTTAALDAYEQVARDFGETTAASEARLRMGELGKYEDPTVRR
jgi:predicted negative regulator of RcsB-dependent stress response